MFALQLPPGPSPGSSPLLSVCSGSGYKLFSVFIIAGDFHPPTASHNLHLITTKYLQYLQHGCYSLPLIDLRSNPYNE